MADWFRCRFHIQEDTKEKELFDKLVSVLRDGQENGEIDFSRFNGYFPERTYSDDGCEETEIGKGWVAFSAVVPYDVSGEKFRDFCSDFGIEQLDCFYAHEREKLADWEGDDDDYKTIGLLTVKKKVSMVVFNGVEEEEVEYDDQRVYPPENDPVKIHQFWSLAWNGNVLDGNDGLRFLNQVKIKRKPIGEIGIRVLESKNDDCGRELTLREALGIDPVEAPFGLLGPKKSWWKPPQVP